MPNWCVNKMTIYGAKEDIKQFLDTVKGENECIDFNKIIPMPAEVDNVYSLNSLEKDMELLKKENSGETLTSKEQERLNSFEKDSDNNPISVKENAKLALYCLEHYGAKDWYDWSKKNWGVKWNASDSHVDYKESDDEATMCFYTAWCYPTPIFEKMAKMFPNLYFEIFCDGVDFGAFFKYEYGKIRASLEGDYQTYYYEDEEEDEINGE